MDISNDNAKTIEELHILEHNLQNTLAQKQMFQVELQEVENALLELKKTNDEVYKILSGVMMRAEKEDLIKELEEKKRFLELRISSIEKQERILGDRSTKLREKLKVSINKERK